VAEQQDVVFMMQSHCRGSVPWCCVRCFFFIFSKIDSGRKA
jgi:hypothetical protein